MQKLELRNHLRDIKTKLNSDFYVDLLSEKGNTRKNLADELFGEMLTTKSGYDNLIQDENKKGILSYFHQSSIFQKQAYISLMSFVNKSKYDTPNQYVVNSLLVRRFYNFHKSVLDSYNLINDQLFQDSELKKSISTNSFEEAEKEGFITFEIMSDESISFDDFALIVSHINNLVNTVIKFREITDEDFKHSIAEGAEIEPRMILADSGSRIILSLKLPKSIARSISKIIDEGWLSITNRAGYKLKKFNTNLELSLSISKNINKALKEEIITEEEADYFKNEISESAKQLLINNTLTKSKADIIRKIAHSNSIDEISSYAIEKSKPKPKELGDGEKKPENEE